MNTTAIRVLIRNDIRLYFSDRRAVIVGVAVPILIAAFFGYIFGGTGGSEDQGMGGAMKFVVSWKVRSGASSEGNEAAAARVLEIFGKWTPPSDETFHQFLGRLDGQGGFAVVETDNPQSLAEAPAKFGPYLEFDIFPVQDITETMGQLAESVEFRKPS